MAPRRAPTAATIRPDAELDAEVLFTMRDLAGVLPRVKIAAVLSQDDVLMRVRDDRQLRPARCRRVRAAPEPRSNVRMAYAAEGTPDPYAGIVTRIIPENITLLAKTAGQTTGGNAWNERTVTLKKGDSISDRAARPRRQPEEIKAIVAALGPRGRDGGVKDGQKLRVLLAPTPDGKRVQPVRVVLANDAGIDAVVALSDLGKYVSVDVRSMDSRMSQPHEEEEDDGKGVRLYQSIYETALRNQVPRPLIDDLIKHLFL